jgi:hypothetical protein
MGEMARSYVFMDESGDSGFKLRSSPMLTIFCEAVCTCNFIIRAIVVDKARIHDGTMLRKSPEYFYNFVAKMLLQHSFGAIVNALVKIDGRMNVELRTYLHRELNKERKVIRKTKFVHSHTSELIQLADMVSGSISWSYRTDIKDSESLRRILDLCIDDIWEFGKNTT